MEHESQTNQPSTSIKSVPRRCDRTSSHRVGLLPPLLCGLFLFTCSLQLASQESPAPLLTEDQAVSIALAANRDIQSSKLDILRADASLREARSNYFPQSQINLISGHSIEAFKLTIPEGALGTYSGIGPVPGKTAVIDGASGMQTAMFATFGQPIAQLYKIHLGVESARVSRQLSAANDLGKRQQVVAQVKEAYHQVAAAQALVASVRSLGLGPMAEYEDFMSLQTSWLLTTVEMKFGGAETFPSRIGTAIVCRDQETVL